SFLVAQITMNKVLPDWTPLAWDLPNAAWAVLDAASAAVFAWLLWLGMKNHGSAERGAKRVLKQVAALGAVAVVAMLAFAAADRAEVLARNFDERIRTRVAFEVEQRGLVADRSASAGTVLALFHTPPKENLDEEDRRPHHLRAVSVRHERAG